MPPRSTHVRHDTCPCPLGTTRRGTFPTIAQLFEQSHPVHKVRREGARSAYLWLGRGKGRPLRPPLNDSPRTRCPHAGRTASCRPSSSAGRGGRRRANRSLTNLGRGLEAKTGVAGEPNLGPVQLTGGKPLLVREDGRLLLVRALILLLSSEPSGERDGEWFGRGSQTEDGATPPTSHARASPWCSSRRAYALLQHSGRVAPLSARP